jgi:nicotinate-nucleotide adenylyltransferase
MKNYDLVQKAKLKNDFKLDNFTNSNKLLKIGIMGGTFDPIHYAHLAIAEFIRDKYKLDKIIFIPSGNPPHKDKNITDKYDRLNMVLLATYENDEFLVSDIEIRRNEKTYTVDTLRYLKNTYKNLELYFITGADAICNVESWKDFRENFKLAKFIAATRPGTSTIKTQRKIEYLSKEYGADIIFENVLPLEISSTYIRHQIKKDKSIRYLLPENVINYIDRESIYCKE